jgi:TrmH family RNA methyltransferase
VSSSYREEGGVDLLEICQQKGITVEYNDRSFNRLSPKDNCFVIGVFSKYSCSLDDSLPHVALVNPGNMGNLGTIIRTMLGFKIKNLAIIGKGADVLDPKAVRASMGAIFLIKYEQFDNIETYMDKFANRDLYTFMLDGAVLLDSLSPKTDIPFTLVFGNEAAGLEAKYQNIGQSVVISHSDEIDSLNLSIAVGIALYQFSK